MALYLAAQPPSLFTCWLCSRSSSNVFVHNQSQNPTTSSSPPFLKVGKPAHLLAKGDTGYFQGKVW